MDRKIILNLCALAAIILLCCPKSSEGLPRPSFIGARPRSNSINSLDDKEKAPTGIKDLPTSMPEHGRTGGITFDENYDEKVPDIPVVPEEKPTANNDISVIPLNVEPVNKRHGDSKLSELIHPGSIIKYLEP